MFGINLGALSPSPSVPPFCPNAITSLLFSPTRTDSLARSLARSLTCSVTATINRARRASSALPARTLLIDLNNPLDGQSWARRPGASLKSAAASFSGTSDKSYQDEVEIWGRQQIALDSWACHALIVSPRHRFRRLSRKLRSHCVITSDSRSILTHSLRTVSFSLRDRGERESSLRPMRIRRSSRTYVARSLAGCGRLFNGLRLQCVLRCSLYLAATTKIRTYIDPLFASLRLLARSLGRSGPMNYRWASSRLNVHSRRSVRGSMLPRDGLTRSNGASAEEERERERGADAAEGGGERGEGRRRIDK